MKQLIVILVEVTSLVAFAASVENPKCEKSPTAVMTVESSAEDGKVSRAQWKKMTPEERKAAMNRAKAESATGREKAEAKRLGIPLDTWCGMTKKERKAVRQEYQARQKGITVEEMKAERTRKEAERVGCPVEKWAAMNVKERCEYRRRLKSGNGVM